MSFCSHGGGGSASRGLGVYIWEGGLHPGEGEEGLHLGGGLHLGDLHPGGLGRPPLSNTIYGRGVCIWEVGSASRGGGGGSASGGSASRKGVGQTPPHRIRCDSVNEGALRILLECILVFPIGLHEFADR